MATEPVPPTTPPLTQLWARWGRSGKLLAIGGLVGIVAAFLPLVSTTIHTAGLGGFSFPGMDAPAMNVTRNAMVVDAWQGKVALAAYVAAIVLVFVLFPPNGLTRKTLAWAGAGVGALAVLLAIWLLISVLRVGGDAFAGAVGFMVTVSIGAYANVFAAILVASGGFLKAQEEGLV